MARYTNDSPAVFGPDSIPNPDPATRQDTFGVWGYDIRQRLLDTSNEFALTTIGNPNGVMESRYLGRSAFDTTTGDLWLCTTIGVAGVAVWENYTQHVIDQVENTLNSRAVVMAIALG